MHTEKSVKEICVCKKTQKQNTRTRKVSYLLGFLIAILPKCPFCAFGYSAVLTLCSGKNLHTYTPSAFYLLPIILSLIIIASLIWNFKGRMSYYAISIAVLATGLITYSEMQSGSETLYYVGVTLLFISVFVNGRFQRILNRFNLKSSSL
jgi:hypothetical protein